MQSKERNKERKTGVQAKFQKNEELTQFAAQVLREGTDVLVDLKPLFETQVEVAAVAHSAL